MIAYRGRVRACGAHTQVCSIWTGVDIFKPNDIVLRTGEWVGGIFKEAVFVDRK